MTYGYLCTLFVRMYGTIDPGHTYGEYMVLLAKSGMTTAAQSTWMSLSSQKSRNFSPVNWVSLLVMIELGTSKHKIMYWTKLTACLEPILARSLALIHLVNLSIATSEWVKPPSTFLKGPNRSGPHTAKDPVTGMVRSSWTGVWIYLTK
jgi:hypothetical protein